MGIDKRMIFSIREASEKDIDQIQVIRRAVKENILTDPKLVSNEDCRIYITQRGKGWVAVSNDAILGFAIADLEPSKLKSVRESLPALKHRQ